MQEIFELFRSLWVVWLGLIFIAIVTWALWPGNRAKFEHASRIPLDDDSLPAALDDGEPRAGGRV